MADGVFASQRTKFCASPAITRDRLNRSRHCVAYTNFSNQIKVIFPTGTSERRLGFGGGFRTGRIHAQLFARVKSIVTPEWA